MKRIGGFKEALWATEKKKREENEMIRLKEGDITANKFAEVIRLALEGKERKHKPAKKKVCKTKVSAIMV